MSNTACDLRYLSQALACAEVYAGQTAPNPPVGAVCVKDGRVIGTGAHQRAGSPHAEVNCLTSCSEDPAGATLYVTLEPCSTHGRTPPCCDLIKRTRIGHAVIGTLDPNPAHAGRAVEILEAAGIRVTVAEGAEAEACRTLIAPFAKAITRKRPYLRLKLAMTLDGFIANADKSSRWVTGEAARAWVQELRNRVDAVLVGSGTVSADHPSLQPRLPGAPKKWRVLADRTVPIAESDCDEHTLVATRDLGYDGSDLDALLKALCARGINDVLCEGGGTLAAALLEAGAVDELNLFYAPKILGDTAAVRGLPTLPRTLATALQFTPFDIRQLGDDTLIRLRPAKTL